MQTRDFSWKIKSVDEAGVFSGLASPYGDPPDLVGDVIQKGAYAQAIRMQPPAGYPLLWAHQQMEPVGVARISDSGPGLAVDGKLFLEDPIAQKAHVHMKGGSVRGISIGFLPPKGDAVEYRQDGARVLKNIHLVELSLVAVPAAPRAQITSVKSLGDVQYLLKSLRDADVDEDALSELQGISHELKRLLVGRDPEEARQQVLSELKAFAAQLSA
jgi:HK97 family phage prohead protease